MTFRIKFIAHSPKRELVTCVAGCVDENDARGKLHTFYPTVDRIMWVEPVVQHPGRHVRSVDFPINYVTEM